MREITRPSIPMMAGSFRKLSIDMAVVAKRDTSVISLLTWVKKSSLKTCVILTQRSLWFSNVMKFTYKVPAIVAILLHSVHLVVLLAF